MTYGIGSVPAGSNPAEGEPLRLTAYRVSAAPKLGLEPASAHRDWMGATDQRFAERCLPLLMANQAGWWVVNSQSFTATWTGRRDPSAVSLQYRGGRAPRPAVSHFGHGIVTFILPWLFRCPPGWDLLVRGPANVPKDGAAPLEGLVEADWSVATFTMNWQLTRPDVPIAFRQDEPIAMLVPQRRDDLERFKPTMTTLRGTSDEAGYQDWRSDREAFLQDLRRPGTSAASKGWQRDYLLGRAPSGRRYPDHRSRMRLQPFVAHRGAAGNPNGRVNAMTRRTGHESPP
jgi:hypothetical protein